MVIAVQSGLAAYDDQVFAAHVVQHLLLMNFAPILYALSAPVTLALQASDRGTQQRLLKVLHHPVVEFAHQPGFRGHRHLRHHDRLFPDAVLQLLARAPPGARPDPPALPRQRAALFWWLVVGRDPSRWRLSYPAKLGILAIGIPVTAVLGVALTGATRLDRPALPHRGRHPSWGVDPVDRGRDHHVRGHGHHHLPVDAVRRARGRPGRSAARRHSPRS